MTALVHGQSSVGAGVVIGSNVFNLAALLGLLLAMAMLGPAAVLGMRQARLEALRLPARWRR